MIKMLFLDYRDFEIVKDLTRRLEPPRKYAGNPVMVSDHPLERQFMSYYGSVIRRPDDALWQTWYSVTVKKIGIALAYAESNDGIEWNRPKLDVVRVGRGKSHIVFDQSPHGAAVFYDEADPRPGWRYKLICGAAPSHRISVFRGSDGIHWQPAAENPVIGTAPDCPISLLRGADGRYAAYHRPGFGDRRVGRTESWDFRNWSEAKMVFDQDPRDDAQTQFYGLGAFSYGAYELGTLWVYHTEENDMGFYKMLGHQEPELAYTRSGYAWRRAEHGTPWIARVPEEGHWEWGNLQPASAPVLMEDEIRFYYVGSRTAHGRGGKWGGPEPCYGIGFASLKPDRFVGVTARGDGLVLTRPFWTETPEFWMNARVARGGSARVEITDLEGKPAPGFELDKCVPVTGDDVRQRLAWRGEPDATSVANREIRLRVRAKKATLYALFAGSEAEAAVYWRFRIPYFLNMEAERKRM